MIADAKKKLQELYNNAAAELDSRDWHGYALELEEIKRKYLGRKGQLNAMFKEIADLGHDLRQQVGDMANQIKVDLEKKIRAKQATNLERAVVDFDVTVPGLKPALGSLHPLSQFTYRITDIFRSLGFEVVEDREVETVEYNFDKLNIAADHPARDMWDTFYVKTKDQESNVVLRTHTSPVQLRAMETRQPPVKLVVPGRVYRHEATDASHETNFYQLEGLVIDRGISVANLIYVLDQVMKRIFGPDTKIRIRPSFFPFVEPGHEVDMSCILCEQRGCSVCSQTGWLEMLGAGMVHPVVLKNMNVDPAVYSGFAFGMGIDRLVMLYHQINDIRLNYGGDLRFLKQFS